METFADLVQRMSVLGRCRWKRARDSWRTV